MILIDEVSMTNATLFVALDGILRQAFEREKPFGGKSIILLGDFCQLPPNGDYSLADILASFQSTNQNIFKGTDAQNVIFLQAAKLFMSFKRVVLTQQMRAADYPKHCETIERF